jgi:hypothetical protein
MIRHICKNFLVSRGHMIRSEGYGCPCRQKWKEKKCRQNFVGENFRCRPNGKLSGRWNNNIKEHF